MAAEAPDASGVAADGGMSAANLDSLGGPPQKGSNKPGQYCYRVTQPRPKPETVERVGVSHNNTLGGRFPWEFVIQMGVLLLVITRNNATITP